MDRARMTTIEMLEAVTMLDTRPLHHSDLRWLLPKMRDAAFIVDGVGPNMRQGMAHVTLMPFDAEFYLVKRFLKRGLYREKHQFTLIIGQNEGELWEIGATFIKQGDMADHLEHIAARHETVRKLMSLGGPPVNDGEHGWW